MHQKQSTAVQVSLEDKHNLSSTSQTLGSCHLEYKQVLYATVLCTTLAYLMMWYLRLMLQYQTFSREKTYISVPYVSGNDGHSLKATARCGMKLQQQRAQILGGNKWLVTERMPKTLQDKLQNYSVCYTWELQYACRAHPPAAADCFTFKALSGPEESSKG